jgi:hypothetical protein
MKCETLFGLVKPSSPRTSRRYVLAMRDHPPNRSTEQRRDALKSANNIRTRRAQLKKDLKAGRVNIESLILDPPEWLYTAKIFDFMMATPKYGRVKVNRILTYCRISPSKTIGGLSERQRGEIVLYLRR